MKTFKTFIAVMAMALVPAMANASNGSSQQNTATEQMMNGQNQQQNPIVGLYEYQGVEWLRGMTLEVRADGTFALREADGRADYGTWEEKEGDVYRFVDDARTCEMNLVFCGNILTSTTDFGVGYYVKTK